MSKKFILSICFIFISINSKAQNPKILGEFCHQNGKLNCYFIEERQLVFDYSKDSIVFFNNWFHCKILKDTIVISFFDSSNEVKAVFKQYENINNYYIQGKTYELDSAKPFCVDNIPVLGYPNLQISGTTIYDDSSIIYLSYLGNLTKDISFDLPDSGKLHLNFVTFPKRNYISQINYINKDSTSQSVIGFRYTKNRNNNLSYFAAMDYKSDYGITIFFRKRKSFIPSFISRDSEVLNPYRVIFDPIYEYNFFGKAQEKWSLPLKECNCK